ncbi:uroporphyrinogen-III synthase, partial [Neisseria sp. P0015.S004]
MPESNNLPQNNAPVIIKQSGGKALAAGATVLALLSLGASGFLFVQGQNVLKNQELEFNQKIDKAALGESENASLLKDNLNRQTAIQAELDRLNNGQKNNSDQILQLQKAYQELLKGRINWLVDEAESMLNTASQQLMLSGNLQGAVSVLEHIDSRLSRF